MPRVVPATVLARDVARALGAAGAPSPAGLGLVLADDRVLAELNGRHLGQSGPTDVLSFPLLPPEQFPDHPGKAPADAVRGEGRTEAGFALPPGQVPLIGEIVISVERAIEQAATGRGGHTGDVRWSARDEVRLLAIHGTLHLCGWDHADPVEEAAMQALERGLLDEA